MDVVTDQSRALVVRVARHFIKIYFSSMLPTPGGVRKRMCIAHGTTSVRHLLGVCFNKVIYFNALTMRTSSQ